MSKLRAFTATLALCAAVSACGEAVTNPPPAPVLGIGMVGGGGRSADGDGSGDTPTSQGDSVTVSAPRQ